MKFGLTIELRSRIMEKRFRDFLRHLDKLDWDVLSDEELRDEREGIELYINVMNQEMLKCVVIFSALLICSSILLSACFISKSQLCFLFAVAFGVVAALFGKEYFKNRDTMNRLYSFADKIAQLF